MIQNSFNPSTSGYAQSDLIASFDAVRPEFRDILFQNYGDQFSKDMRFLYDMNAKRAIQNSSGGFHFEEDRFDTVVTVKANAGTSGTTLSFTLAADEIDSVSGDRTSYPAIGDLIADMESMQRFEITNKTDNGSDTTITAISIDGQTAITPTVGKEYVIYSQASPENSDAPAAKDSYWTKYSYKLQRIRTTGAVTGDAAGDELFAQYTPDGKFVGNWVGFNAMTTEWRHLKAIIGMVVLGKQGTAGNDTSTGMMEAFSTRANTVDISGGVGYTSLQETVNLLKPNSTKSNHIGLICRNLSTDLFDDIRSDFANTNLNAVRQKSAELIFGNSAASDGLMATYDFNTVTINGFTFNLRLFDLSFDPNVFGNGDAATNQFSNTAYFMPSEATVDPTNTVRRHMELAYLSNSRGGVDRLMSVVKTGRNAPIPTNSIDHAQIDFLTQAGLDFYAMKQCAYWYNADLS